MTGEPGIDKTTLVNIFLHRAQTTDRLWHQQGKQEAARHSLAEIYQWFAKGFDTQDLQTAQTLLAQWSASSQNAAQLTK